MSSIEDLETRVAALERQAADVRQDAAAARVLAGAADRDVSEFRVELRAHTSTLNALRETQLEQQEQLARLEDKVDSGLARLEGKVNDGFTKTSLGMAQITALLQNLTNET
ncbi:MAG TPA: hypothetical protein VH352_27060 [Pseudonocardiaceae bacterium]|jgi:chromosome segregation ATPase|nr:hypothetical protein [Pseudonocardiaceae bacterium]